MHIERNILVFINHKSIILEGAFFTFYSVIFTM